MCLQYYMGFYQEKAWKCNSLILPRSTNNCVFQFQSLIDSTSGEGSLDDEVSVRMVALFDHEEVGSDSAQGAGSPAMFDALSRITDFFSPSGTKVIYSAKLSRHKCCIVNTPI